MLQPQDLIRPEIHALSAYHVTPAQGMLKLDAMENPYAWPGELAPELIHEWQAQCAQAELNRYPDPQGTALTSQLRIQLGLSDDLDIMLGNGSDELIQILALALMSADRAVLAPIPSFVMYQMIAVYTGMRYVGVALQDDFALDIQAMLAAIEEHQPVLVFLAYPNNPTGNLFAADDIEAIIRATPGLVVVDEAYAPFAQASFISRLAEFDNLLIMRTLSKLGLAGLRLGYLLGAKHWLYEFNKCRLPYNINSLTQLSATFALQHQTTLTRQAALICQEREQLQAELARLPGIRVYPSAANFILIRTARGEADKIYTRLIQQGVLIKNLANQPELSDCLRITVGSPQQNQRLLHGLSAALN